MSKLQKLEELREMTRLYAKALEEAGVNQDEKLAKAAVKLLQDELVKNEPEQPQRPLALEYSGVDEWEKTLPVPRGARPRAPTIVPAPYAVIAGGMSCRTCGHEFPTVVPELTAEALRERKKREIEEQRIADRIREAQEEALARQAIENLKLKEPGTASVLPLLTRDQSREMALKLANTLRRNPNYPREPESGCYNCGKRAHTHRECPYRRGTFCGRCGEEGMIFAECPRCFPDKYGLSNVKPFVPGRR